MWVLLAILFLAILGIIAVIVYVDLSKDDDEETETDATGDAANLQPASKSLNFIFVDIYS